MRVAALSGGQEEEEDVLGLGSGVWRTEEEEQVSGLGSGGRRRTEEDGGGGVRTYVRKLYAVASSTYVRSNLCTYVHTYVGKYVGKVRYVGTYVRR